MRFLPSSATPTAKLILITRGMRSVADGCVSVLLPATSLLILATGIGFAAASDFWPLLLIAFVGTLNPSSGDVSVFLPLEQSLLPQTTEAKSRTALFARYGVAGTLAAAAGSLCAGVPALLSARLALDVTSAIQMLFGVYALLGLVAF